MNSLRLPILLLLLLFGYPVLSQDIGEADMEEQSVTAEYSREVIEKIFKGEDFYSEETARAWRLREGLFDNDKDKEEEVDEDSFTWPDWIIDMIEEIESWSIDFSGFIEWLSYGPNLLEFLLWIVVVSLLLYLLLHYRQEIRRWIKIGGKGKKATHDAPDILFGLDVREESLPDDVPAQVMQMWLSGQQREALSLLFRATLSRLIHKGDFRFYDGHTEQECADLVAIRGIKPLSNYMYSLTSVWQKLAYGHRFPEQGVVENFCEHWNAVLDLQEQQEERIS